MNEYLKDFKDYLLKQLKAIETLEASKDKVLFKKILYISFIESLAKARYPNIEGSKKRFVKFLADDIDWKDCNLYSFVHIAQNSHFDNKIFKYSKDKVDKLLSGGMFHDSMLVSSPSFKIPKEYVESQTDLTLLESCAYGTILYNKIRNGLVHQFQAPTESNHPNDSTKIIPYFQISTQMEPKINKDGSLELKEVSQNIQIIFPNKFLQKLAEDGLNSFVEYCQKEKVNPFKLRYDSTQILHEKDI